MERQRRRQAGINNYFGIQQGETTMSFQFRSSLILLALGALLLAGCSLVQPKSGSGNSSSSKDGSVASSSGDSSSRAATSFSPTGDARKDVRDALLKLNTAYPYRLTETTTATASGQTTPETTRIVEFAAANRSHMKWTGGPAGNIEAISIGDKHYWFSNGKWTEGTVPSMLGPRGEDFAKKLAEMVREVRYIGPETVNGMSCFAYTGTFETVMAGQTWSGTAKVWIGAADGLLHQSDSEFKAANYGGKSHLVYEYDANIKVEPPAM
jgi:hypothetical protein